MEACWNWGLIHDELEELECVEEVVLAHPYKTRLIADAQIKTDRLDAHALGTLRRGNLVARADLRKGVSPRYRDLISMRSNESKLRIFGLTGSYCDVRAPLTP